MIPFLIVPCLGLALPPLDLPRLFRQLDFNSRDLAQAANYFVAMGEERTAKKIASLASEFGSDWWRAWAAANPHATNFSLNSRLSWMCRILYEPKGNEPLRQPLFGALHLPYHSMPLVQWPLYPLAQSGDTYFVLGDGYSLAGHPESMIGYLRYCKANGTFRKKQLPMPDGKQALKDFGALIQSAKWKAIKWRDSGGGWSYSFSEQAVLGALKSQAEEIPEK
jgi:hypothetical protein